MCSAPVTKLHDAHPNEKIHGYPSGKYCRIWLHKGNSTIGFFLINIFAALTGSQYLIVSCFFSHLGFWSGNIFLIATFPDLCLLVLFYFI